MLRGLAAGAAALLLAGRGPLADEAGGGVVRAVTRGDLLRLEDGRELRLAGIVTPGPLSGHDRAAPLAEEARAALEDAAAGRKVAFVPLGGDRHGRILAEVAVEGGGSLQGGLVQRGLAWVWPGPLPPAAFAALLEEERAAEAAGRGLWAMPWLRPEAAASVRANAPRFALVSGRVLETARQRRYVYLNFGADWRRDFTARVPLPEARVMERAGFDPQELADRVVRVRGWLFAMGGPMIEVTERGQIEELA
ncbi:thermonuclease family protein [Marinimicrococcus flavescens]|uniref:Thermonuclease family protein n=1 Tax=Marinimicrococcus flavescens TaxID=3031815 RepID=A0AAP3XT16_9PROT|nr:thermonuclease family protein [Marinimicrococcus flavescens]